MRLDRIRCIATALIMALAAAPAARGGEASPPAADPSAAVAAPLRVADLAWLAGAWHGTFAGDAIEEHWSAAAGGEMLGMFRWHRRPLLYQLLVVEDAPEGVVLRLRHFGPGLVAWEEKEGAVVFRPVEHGPCWVLFVEQGDDEERNRLLRYSREADGGLLVEFGADSSLDFHYRPAGPPAAAPGCAG